jgi:PAS domain S-box-containing protein
MEKHTSVSVTQEDLARLLDENEQLRASLETALEENGKLVEERDRLLCRAATLANDVLAARATEATSAGEVQALTDQLSDANQAVLEANAQIEEHASKSAQHPQTEEELRLAFEEMQVLAEELEAANSALNEANDYLEARVAERTKELEERRAALHKSEAALRTIANLVPDLLWETDGVGNARWFNDRWFSYTGFERHKDFGVAFLQAVHPDDQDELRRTWTLARAAGAIYEHEVRLRGVDGAYRWILMRVVPDREGEGPVLYWFGAGTDIHDQRMTYEALQQAEQRLTTLVEGVWQLVWRAACDGSWTWSSSQWTLFTGLSKIESQGEGWLEAVHPDDRARVQAAWKEAEARSGFDQEMRILDVREGRYRHFRSRAAPVRNEAGQVVEWLGTSTDVDDLIQLQQQQAVLVAELQHRTRNLMGVVESIVRRTIKGSTSLEDFRDGIFDRLATLTRVQGLLSRRVAGARVSFEALIREELTAHVAFDGDGKAERVSMSGPPETELFSASVQTLALALHELATNAVKYGALSTAEGHLDISWAHSAIDGRPSVRVIWKESGVSDMPADGDAPKGSGFGRELIEQALPYQLGARTSYRFEEDGVRCTIEIPLATER